ncbi:iron complex transport system substrate-binding protein [Rhodothalassium salexigens DSM 2132]|uniref:Iron complex transport system substrate-binding protein n=1 Tax=Rhodothalassium salexigens DSM 2132 TaxID=1188247 RepID=A0A4R2PGR3_RHOSA|nr:ABC transporter substrate-binding protein [Rhodothalassium salexigens]MBB4211506.1 iron complex transport system substrate-binding protein [Rhodothalassium salexigens DSM 2132]MBK1639743.1 hypothetical protein [Rhodothalassium salexigens DSM 2132]TCP34562.1 iron complex transport system substrate-binding protein [Rhodothalassium salexigens DSM 2132]
MARRLCRRGRPPWRGLGSAVAGLAGLAFLAAPALAGAAGAAALPRVASASVCADQYVLALADPEQIVSVTERAAGPLSFYAERAQGLPTNRRALEEFLVLDVDVVVLDTHDVPQLRRTLPRFGVSVVDLATSAAHFDAVYDEIAKVARAVGQPARGEALVADIRQRLAVLRDRAAQAVGSDRRRLVSYFRPDGGGAGRGTFVHTVLDAAGFENLQARLGFDGWGGIPMEQLVLTPPEAGVTSFFDLRPNAVGNRFGSHPFYRHLARNDALVPIPGRLWPCAGPMLIDAAEALFEARDRYTPLEEARP